MPQDNLTPEFDAIWERVELPIRLYFKESSPGRYDLINWLQFRELMRAFLMLSIEFSASPDLAMGAKYLFAAETDARAANILYENGEISQAVYHLQQAAEKATKALCLLIGATTLERLRHEHTSPRPLLTLLEHRLFSAHIKLFGQLARRDYRKVLKRAKLTVNSDCAQLARLPLKTTRQGIGIGALIDSIDGFAQNHSRLIQTEKDIKDIFVSHLPEFAQYVPGYSTIIFGQAAAQCYAFGVVTFVHENLTRYPGGLLEPKDYDQDLGIVQAFPMLMDRLPLLFQSIRQVAGSYSKTAPDSC